MKISNLDLSKRLNFISIFIALYESFSDYVIDCPKQLFNEDIRIRTDLKQDIENQTEKYKKLKEEAKEILNKDDNYNLSLSKLEKLKTVVDYNYIKCTQDGYTLWLKPEYDKQIKSKVINVRGKNKKKCLFNSVMFFIDKKVLEENDFNNFLEIRNLRNKLVHEMSELILLPTEEMWKNMFKDLIDMYIKINNYWCVMFELSIASDIPKNINIDFDNVITTDLYNLLLSIDLLFSTKFVIDKKWMALNGLYKGICLPLTNENQEETQNG